MFHIAVEMRLSANITSSESRCLKFPALHSFQLARRSTFGRRDQLPGNPSTAEHNPRVLSSGEVALVALFIWIRQYGTNDVAECLRLLRALCDIAITTQDEGQRRITGSLGKRIPKAATAGKWTATWAVIQARLGCLGERFQVNSSNRASYLWNSDWAKSQLSFLILPLASLAKVG
jgi:hypothetical protein